MYMEGAGQRYRQPAARLVSQTILDA